MSIITNKILPTCPYHTNLINLQNNENLLRQFNHYPYAKNSEMSGKGRSRYTDWQPKSTINNINGDLVRNIVSSVQESPGLTLNERYSEFNSGENRKLKPNNTTSAQLVFQEDELVETGKTGINNLNRDTELAQIIENVAQHIASDPTGNVLSEYKALANTHVEANLPNYHFSVNKNNSNFWSKPTHASDNELLENITNQLNNDIVWKNDKIPIKKSNLHYLIKEIVNFTLNFTMNSEKKSKKSFSQIIKQPSTSPPSSAESKPIGDFHRFSMSNRTSRVVEQSNTYVNNKVNSKFSRNNSLDRGNNYSGEVNNGFQKNTWIDYGNTHGNSRKNSRENSKERSRTFYSKNNDINNNFLPVVKEDVYSYTSAEMTGIHDIMEAFIEENPIKDDENDNSMIFDGELPTNIAVPFSGTKYYNDGGYKKHDIPNYKSRLGIELIRAMKNWFICNFLEDNNRNKTLLKFSKFSEIIEKAKVNKRWTYGIVTSQTWTGYSWTYALSRVPEALDHYPSMYKTWIITSPVDITALYHLKIDCNVIKDISSRKDNPDEFFLIEDPKIPEIPKIVEEDIARRAASKKYWSKRSGNQNEKIGVDKMY